jgi:tellurite methyltransferase
MGFDDLYQTTKDAFGAGPEKVLVSHFSRLDRSRPVLDIGVGQGRHAFFLARQGFAVHAIDSSQAAVDLVTTEASEQGWRVHAQRCGFEEFKTDVESYAAVLIFGLIPILTRDQITVLMDRLESWAGVGTHVFVTAFTTRDPKFPRHRKDWTEIERNSFESPGGEVRTYLEPGEIVELFSRYSALHHWEGLGPVHRHGEGPPERHGVARAVFRKR